MLSYQHEYHAGNHADVLKHWILIECLAHLQKKEKPFDYIDTHAGAGMYRLDSFEAKKTSEFKDGIEKILNASIPGLEEYQRLVREDLKHQSYPGSPEIVNRSLRHGDNSWLFELHPKTFRQLEQNCARKRQTRVRNEDGLAGLNSLLPVPSRRALVLIDPSYEVKAEYEQVVNAIGQAWRKMPQTQFLLWYPVVDRQRIDRMEKRFKQSNIKNVHLFEMGVMNDDNDGMTASGIIAVNPPWTLVERFTQVIPKVASLIAKDGKNRSRHTILAPE